MIGRVREQLPGVVRSITTEIGNHIDQLLDPKIMVIEHFRNNPALVNRIFYEVGSRELKLMVNFGFVFGFLLGIPVAVIDHQFGIWWLLPFMGVIVGWVTNEPDGSVRVAAEGDDEAVEALVSWCRTGPPAARVEHADVVDASPTGERGFRVR